MSALESLLLGVIQGITEFLPISSSGHLVLARYLLRLAEIPLLYDVLLHFSTLAVVVVVFRKKIASILASIWNWLRASSTPADGENLRLCLLILLATLITGVLGFFGSLLEDTLFRNPTLLSLCFLATALILFLTRFFNGERGYPELGFGHAALIGLAQGLGVLPGISRAGITIAVALFCGLKRERAGEFSFLIAIPAFLGALVLKLNQAANLLEQVSSLPLVVGILSSLVVGFLSLLLLLRLVRRGRLYYFSLYLLPLGLVSLLLLSSITG